MAITFTFTTDSIPGDEPVIAQSFSNRITIRERDPVGTTSYLVREGSKTAPQCLVRAGDSWSFWAGHHGNFSAGAIVGWVSASTGSITMQQLEQAEDAPVNY